MVSNAARPRSLLVTGATGCIGTAILELLAGSEVEVHALTRTGHLPLRSENIIPVKGVLADGPELAKKLPPIRSCINAAAAVHAPHLDEEVFHRTNVTEPFALAGALAARGALDRFVFVSTIAAAEVNGPRPATPYARSKAEGERRIAELATARGFEATVVRLATVYGARDRGNIRSLFDAIRRHRYVRLVSGDVMKSLISAEAAAAALIIAADPNVPVPPLTVLADPEPYRLSEIEDALVEAAGVEAVPRLPSILGWPAAAVGSLLEATLPLRSPLTLRKLRTLQQWVEVLPGPPGPLVDAASARTRPLAEGFRRAYIGPVGS